MERLAPPPTDPLVRSEPPFEWGRTPEHWAPRVETNGLVELDPDLSLWRTVELTIFPFTGAPTEGEWPTGWMGIDNTGTVWVCTLGGEPGTWAAQGGTSGQMAFAFDHTMHAALAAGVDTGIFIPEGHAVIASFLSVPVAFDGTTPVGGMALSQANAVAAANDLFTSDLGITFANLTLADTLSTDLYHTAYGVSGIPIGSSSNFVAGPGGAHVWLAVTDGSSGDPGSTVGSGVLSVIYAI